MDMDMDTVYEEAARGNFEAFEGLDKSELLQLVTLNHKNTILHIHITGRFIHSDNDFLGILLGLRYIPPLEKVILGDLSKVSRKSSVDFVKKVLERCNDMRWKANAEDETLLHLAARYGHNDIVKVLLSEGGEADSVNLEAAKSLLEMVNKAGDTALHEAARYGHPHVVKELLNANPNHSYGCNNDGKTPLYLASEMGNPYSVSEILNSSRSPLYHGPNGETALHPAVLHNRRMITRMLVKKLKDLAKEADDSGWIPLHYAAREGFLRIVIILMEEDKSTATIGDKVHNMTAIHVAAKYRRTNVMREIMSRCPQCCELEDNIGDNLLHFIVQGNSKRALIAALYNPFIRLNLANKSNKEGKRPLHQLPSNFDFHSFTRNMTPSLSAWLRYVFWLSLGQKNICSLGEWEDINYEDSCENDIDEGRLRKGGVTNKDSSKDNEYEGKKWLGASKKDASYKDELQIYLVVATLIATVTFAAAFTMPGGYISDKGPEQGSPVLIKSAAFKVFVVADIISMVLSILAVLIPIYVVDFQRKSLHAALKVARTTTFFALIAMVVAFCTGSYAVLSPSSLWLATLCYGLPPVLAYVCGVLYYVLIP